MVDRVDMGLPSGTDARRPSESYVEEENQETRESWQLPGLEKFQSPDALAASYLELQKQMGSRDPQPEATTENEEASPDSLTIPQPAPETYSVDRLAPFTDEFSKTGQLSEDSFTKLDEMGLPRNLVEGYIQGQQAIGDRAVGSIHKLVGGSDEYNRLMQWAGTSLDEKSRDAFDAQVTSGDVNAAELAVRGLHAQYREANGGVAPLLEGQRANGAAAGAFRSQAEVVKAMQDPRYQKDEAYVKDVRERLRNSDVFG